LAGVAGYEDRFDASTYVDDESVHLFRADRYGQDDEDEVWMAESVWHRIRLIAAAYSLHLLPVLDGSTDPVFLNSLQTATLVDELFFINAVVDDELISAQVRSIDRLALGRSHGASKDPIAIEFP